MTDYFEPKDNPRVIAIQKLYGYFLNKDAEITFPKHKYKKFIKDIVNGTIERNELIDDLLKSKLKDDINDNKTEIILKLIIKVATYEFMFLHRIPVKVVINEYLKVSDFFIENSQKRFLNAILDKIAKVSRVSNK
tara:strand:- start:874 stop:1278 length:405 start_codon:yes stop_codon:yes gene_type:complete